MTVRLAPPPDRRRLVSRPGDRDQRRRQHRRPGDLHRLTLLAGIGLRAGLVVLAGSLVGIMSPVVLFFGDLFPGFVPTLEAQYVLKDIILAGAGAVVAARALGARYVAPDDVYATS